MHFGTIYLSSKKTVIELQMCFRWEPDLVSRLKILVVLVRARPGKELPLKNAIVDG